MSQSRWTGQFCKQNKLAKSVSFVFKLKAKHVIEVEEKSQCLEESQNCFESKVGEEFRFIDQDNLRFTAQELAVLNSVSSSRGEPNFLDIVQLFLGIVQLKYQFNFGRLF